MFSIFISLVLGTTSAAEVPVTDYPLPTFTEPAHRQCQRLSQHDAPTGQLQYICLFCFAPHQEACMCCGAEALSLAGGRRAGIFSCSHLLMYWSLGQSVIKCTDTGMLFFFFKLFFLKKLHTSETDNNLNTMQFQYVQKLGHRDPV